MGKKIKFCPMLTGQQEVKALTIGSGDYTVPIMRLCLLEHCTAYTKTIGGEGFCKHYHTKVEYTESEDKKCSRK